MYEAIPKTPLEFNDFSGGKTDNYLKCRPNQFEEADNLFITADKRLRTRPGRLIYNDTYYQIPIVGGQRVGAMISHDGELFIQSAKALYWINSGWQTLTGPSSNSVFSAGTTSSYIASAIWNRHLILVNDAFSSPMKVFKNSSDTWCVRNAGLPDLATTPTFTHGTPGSTFSYIYRFCYEYTYTVGQVSFQDQGPMTEVVATGNSAIAAGAGNTMAISAIPVIANGATGNYDTTVIKVFIHRTEDAGTVFYKVGEVTNGTTTFNDTTTDAALVLLPKAYTEGGVLDNDPPPAAKFVVTAGDKVWYAWTKENGVEYPSRLRQSNPFDPDSCPAGNFHTLEDDFAGLGAVGVYPIALCKSRIYRIEGGFDKTGRGSIVPKDISRVVGCVSHQSIVNTERGVFFAGTDGFYYTDGYQCKKISDEFNTTYNELISTTTKQKNIQGMYDALENRVYWTVQREDSSGENDAIFVADLRWGIEFGGVFTTLSGQSTFFPTALCYHNRTILHSDEEGYIYKFDEGTDTDPKRDLLLTPDAWDTQTILHDYKGPATNFGVSEMVKLVPHCTLTIQNETNMGVSVESNNNDSGNFRKLKEVRYFENINWGDPSVIWRSTAYDYAWNVTELIKAKRRFPAGYVKCETKQMRFTNSVTIIYNSDVYGEGSLSASLKTLTLLTEEWPTDIVDYYVSFEADGYVGEYLILTRNSDTVLTFSDPLGAVTLDDASTKWVVKGKRKGDRMILVSYTLWHGGLGLTQNPYKTSKTGGNE